MGDLLLRGLDEQAHDELRRRSRDAGMSLQAYASGVLERHLAAPSLHDWLRQLDDLPAHPDVRGAAAVREARDELL